MNFINLHDRIGRLEINQLVSNFHYKVYNNTYCYWFHMEHLSFCIKSLQFAVLMVV
ncbi:hypothetical protein SAMN02745664_102190 [Moraxella cuniculi DSM 21768]|uniref:Uncharacterized protein n=1 Tax=Moraxella cuniculi DSM 21768 TaxID=1122245 RepID=A0A1N7DWV1_9GAMM|nr:hypothetical protein SAMN02745664_102190 [Moraxella cuniculi DSM 21768]